MGLNLNLCHMLGLPEETACPACGETTGTGFEDCDVEAPRVNPEPRVWSFQLYCPHCEHEWRAGYLVASLPLEDEFRECDECRVKPGSPLLCPDCLERRSEHGRTGKCRPPRECSSEAKEKAQKLDERMAAHRLRA
jgi:hypothetical protein